MSEWINNASGEELDEKWREVVSAEWTGNQNSGLEVNK